jgi:hypothetical protein
MSLIVTATDSSSVTWYADGGHALEQPYSPWSAPGGWRADLRFEVDAAGSLSEGGVRSVMLTAKSPNRETTAIAHLGDTFKAPGISVYGPVETAYAPVTITTDTTWVLSMDTRAGVLRGKLWALAPFEPTAWDVEVPLTATDDDEVDVLEIQVNVGNVTSEQTVTLHLIKGRLAANETNLVLDEVVGLADGTTREFPTSHRFHAHTLRGVVNGVGVMPKTSEPDSATFTLDGYPTAGMVIRARYLAVRTE